MYYSALVLKSCDRCRGFELPYDDPAGYTAPPAFGPFRVLHQIGSGAQGPVFRAFESSRERLTAVKVFRLSIVPEDAARLADELRRLAAVAVDPAHVVPVLAAGLEGATPFVAMEYVASDTLDVWLRRLAPAPLDRARPVLRGLAEALDAARRAGLTHGALHPRDVFVSHDEARDEWTVRVGGFGVTTALEAVGVRVAPRRPYGAPERVPGSPWDHRADIYSLGVIAHELLTGRRPSGGGEQDGALPTGTTPEQRVAIRRALAGALAESPDARFGSALALVEALETGDVPVPPAAVQPEAPVAAEAVPVAVASPAPPVEVAAAPPAAVPAPAAEPELRHVPPPREASWPVRTPTAAAPPMVPAPGADRLALLWPLLIVAMIAGIGLGYWWRDPAPPAAQAPLVTVSDDPMAGTDVAVQDVPAPPEAPGATPAPSPDPALAPAAETRGRVLVRSIPDGARVLIGGRVRGTTPAVVRDLPFGTHTITVLREGFTTRTHRVTLSRAVPARDVTIELRPVAAARTGSLDISTRPAGARVTLDGKFLGQAPMRVPEVLPGSHTIRLEMAGYRTVTTTVVVRAGQQVPVRVSLEVM